MLILGKRMRFSSLLLMLFVINVLILSLFVNESVADKKMRQMMKMIKKLKKLAPLLMLAQYKLKPKIGILPIPIPLPFPLK